MATLVKLEKEFTSTTYCKYALQTSYPTNNGEQNYVCQRPHSLNPSVTYIDRVRLEPLTFQDKNFHSFKISIQQMQIYNSSNFIELTQLPWKHVFPLAYITFEPANAKLQVKSFY